MQNMFLIFSALLMLGLEDYLRVASPADGGVLFGGLCALWLLSAGFGFYLCRRLLKVKQQAQGDLQSFLFKTHISGMAYRLLLLGIYGIMVFVLGWPAWIRGEFASANSGFINYFFAFLPMALLLLIQWLTLFPLENMLRGGQWKLSSYLRFQQINFMMVIPFFLMSALLDLQNFLPTFWRLEMETNIFLMNGVFFAVATFIALLSPFILRALFKSSPLPSGGLRDSLTAISAKAGVGFRNILVWHTDGGRVPNAMVTGFLPRLRYVFISDELLRSFPQNEIEAVFGHEIGHAKHFHLHYFFLLMFSITFIIAFFCDLWNGLGLDDWFSVSLCVGGILFLGFVFFGYLSRRFERQADLFGAQMTDGGLSMQLALLRLGDMAGKVRRIPSWRHFSIPDRVAFLDEAQRDQGIIRKFNRQLRGLKLGYLLAFMLLLILSLPFMKKQYHQDKSRLEAFYFQTLRENLARHDVAGDSLKKRETLSEILGCLERRTHHLEKILKLDEYDHQYTFELGVSRYENGLILRDLCVAEGRDLKKAIPEIAMLWISAKNSCDRAKTLAPPDSADFLKDVEGRIKIIDLELKQLPVPVFARVDR